MKITALRKIVALTLAFAIYGNILVPVAALETERETGNYPYANKAADEEKIVEITPDFINDEFIVEGYTGGPVEEEQLPRGSTAYTTPAIVTPTKALERLENLAKLFKADDNNDLDNAYFTVDQQTCSSGYHDVSYCNENCKLSLILQKSWIKDLIGAEKFYMGTMPGHYLPKGTLGSSDGYQCYAFANFAMWYVFAQKNTDKVSPVLIAHKILLTYENMQKYGVLPGDILRTGTEGSGQHSMVVMSYDKNSVTVIDCNAYTSKDPTACRVHVRNIRYSVGTTVTVTAAQNCSRDGMDSITYTVNYDANGGIGAPQSQSKEYGKDMTLSNVVPVKEGYTFMGWKIGIDGEKLYAPGETYSENASITFYAHWVKAGTKTGNLYIEPLATQAKPGDTVKVKLWLKQNPGINTINSVFEYDSGVLELNDRKIIVDSAMYTEGKFSFRLNSRGLYISWTSSGNDNISTNIVMATLTFTVKESAKTGVTNFGFKFDVAKGSSNLNGDEIIWKDSDDVKLNIIEETYSVTVTGSGKNDVTAADTVKAGETFTFTLAKDENYDYAVTSNHSFTDNGDGTYTVTNVTGDITINVEKTEKTVIFGDVDGDGKTTGFDAAKIFDHCNGKTELSEEQTKTADCNGDGKVTVRDAMLVYDFVNGK